MEINISSESLVWLCQIVFVVATLIQFVFLLFVQGRLAFFKGESKSSNSPGVSVVIAARNEEGNLLQNLPSVLEQDYPEFEVIVINDSSVDDSITVLRAFEINYPQLRVINILENDNYEGGKKYAITLGVKGAKYERLIFTDADCRPVSRKWIQKVVASRTAEGNIVLGYSPYQKTSGFLNRIVRFETFSNGLNYLSFALSGMPYMGVGRNLSYDRSSFFKVGGFKSHYRLLSGDDDLFVNEVANKSNTDICLEEESIVESIPEDNWKSYWMQKRRHLTTGFNYRLFHRFLLIAQPLSLILFWLSSLSLLVSHNWVEITLIVVALRLIAQLYIFKRSSRWLGQTDLIALAPIFEILIVLITTCAHAANAVSTRVTWKT